MRQGLSRIYRLEQILLIGALMLMFMRSDVQGQDVEAMFVKGKKLIEINCGDCMEASEAGLIEGIKQVQTAIEAGYPEPADGYRVLAGAYGTLAYVYVNDDKKRQEESLDKQLQAYEALLKTNSLDANDWYEYSSSLQALGRKSDALHALERAFELDHESSTVAFNLSLSYAESDQVPKALELFKTALNHESDISKIKRYGGDLCDRLRARYHSDEVAIVRKSIDKKAAILKKR